MTAAVTAQGQIQLGEQGAACQSRSGIVETAEHLAGGVGNGQGILAKPPAVRAAALKAHATATDTTVADSLTAVAVADSLAVTATDIAASGFLSASVLSVDMALMAVDVTAPTVIVDVTAPTVPNGTPVVRILPVSATAPDFGIQPVGVTLGGAIHTGSTVGGRQVSEGLISRKGREKMIFHADSSLYTV